jgi:acetyl esterase/lipase
LWQYFFVGLVLVATTGCSPLVLVNGLSPSGHYELRSDLAYGSHARQTLDVYTPLAVKGPAPMVIFFYGGGWREGSKDNYRFVASSLTEAGYVVVIPEYRVFPEVVFPEFIDDGADAVAWALQHASEFGADSDKVFLMGHSAGAHIAAMLITDQHFLASNGIDADTLAGFVGLSGPYNFLPLESGYLLEVFPEHNRNASQPINYVTDKTPPALLIHGTGDDLVYASNSETMAQRLAEHGVDVTLKLYEGVGHARVAVELSPPFDFTGETLADTLEFLHRIAEKQSLQSL